MGTGTEVVKGREKGNRTNSKTGVSGRRTLETRVDVVLEDLDTKLKEVPKSSVYVLGTRVLLWSSLCRVLRLLIGHYWIIFRLQCWVNCDSSVCFHSFLVVRREL